MAVKIYLALPKELAQKIKKVQKQFPTRNSTIVALIRKGLDDGN